MMMVMVMIHDDVVDLVKSLAVLAGDEKNGEDDLRMMVMLIIMMLTAEKWTLSAPTPTPNAPHSTLRPEGPEKRTKTHALYPVRL